MPPKINLKDKFEDGEIDLSLLELQDVPVREIALLKKAHSLDLSNNSLIVLPKNFNVLTNIVKLDLSRNLLKELPENFGDLVKLKHLDLYKNQLQHLPLSFGKLKALRWLDLNDNPLVPAIKSTAGTCSDSKECQSCAKNIVEFYSNLQDQVNKERDQREKQRQRDKQAHELANQKVVQEKKKKDKNKKKENHGPKNKTDTIVHKETQPVQKVKKSKQSGIPALLRFFLSTFIFVTLTLFVLTATRCKLTEPIEKLVVSTWNDCINRLPPNWQPYGMQSTIYFKQMHNMTGEAVFTTKKFILEIPKSDFYRDTMKLANDLYLNIVQRLKLFYNNISSTDV